MSNEKKVLTREEEADEIIRRLATPPQRPLDLEKELMEILAAEIAKEIDAQVIITAKQWQKKNPLTLTSLANHLAKVIT
jgi:hypothetical protein